MPVHAPFLRYFQEVARCGSVRLAASRLFISSSAVNRQILKIESELGTQLFNRTAQGMELTAAGRILQEHIERTLIDAERTLETIIELEGNTDKPVTIAGQESIIGEFLSSVLMQFHVACPSSCSAFMAAGGDELNQLLIDAQADMIVVFDQQRDTNILEVCERLLPVGAIVSPSHPLADKGNVSLHECTQFPLILPDASWPLRTRLDAKLDDLNAAPTVVSSSNSVEFLRCMVDRQLGVGFQTAMGIESQLQQGILVHVPLRDPEPMLQRLSLCVSRTVQRSVAFEQLLDLLDKRLHTYADQWA